MAGRVEAYRERWGVGIDELRERPIDGVQCREWAAVDTAEMFGSLEAPEMDPAIEVGYGIDL